MGWNDGSGLFGELIFSMQKAVPDEDARKEVYEHMIDSFVEMDCDTLSECLGTDTVFDEVYGEKFPDEVEPEEDEVEELDFEE